MKMRFCRRERGAAAAAAAIGFAWYLLHGGLGTLNPTEIGWVRSEDLSQHFLGWAHFRNAPLGWPLGRVPQLGYSVGTTVGFMDANPWLCMVFRPFSRWLPTYFQFQGLWLASCYALLAVFAHRIARLYTPDLAAQLLWCALITTAPPALLRVCHENLAAQWLLLAAIYLCLRAAPSARAAAPGVDGAATSQAAFGHEAVQPAFLIASRSEAWSCAVSGVLLLVLSVGAHAYLSVMIAPLLALAVLRRGVLDRTLSVPTAIGIVGGYVAAVLATLYAFGFIGTGIEQSEPGFGEQTADVLALINPVGWSRFLPSYPHTADQFEGFSYLGLGGIAAALIGAAAAWRRQSPGRHAIMWRALFAMAVPYTLFALSDCIWFRGQLLFTVRPYIRPLFAVLSIFRASGRFIWLLHYLLVLFGCAAIVQRFSIPRARLVLAVVLALQLADLQPQDVREKLTRRETSPLQHQAWSAMAGDYKHLALYPAFYPSNKKECGWRYPWGYHVPYSFAAYEAGMSFNSNYAGRADALRIGPYCTQFNAAVAAGRFEDDTVYVVGKGFEQSFASSPKLACREIDRTLVCVSRARQTRLMRLLAESTQPVVSPT